MVPQARMEQTGRMAKMACQGRMGRMEMPALWVSNHVTVTVIVTITVQQ
jgi:hypothetical protein